MNVKQLCGPFVSGVNATDSLRTVAELMRDDEIASLAVFDRNRFAGMITERDLTRAAAYGADFTRTAAAEFMTAAPVSVAPGTSVVKAADTMLETGVRHLPVVDRGVLVGIVSIRDVLAALRAA